jgi:thiol-disulfide isomerase/thioredoxin
MLTSRALCVSLALAALFSVPPAANAVGIAETVPQFTTSLLKLEDGKTLEQPFDSHKTPRPTVYLFVGTTCPTTAAYVERLKQVESEYAAKGVDFVYVYPNRNDTRDAKLEFHGRQGLHGAVIDDQGGSIARAMNAKRTAEVFIVGKDGKVVYHGGIDDSKDPAGVQRRHLAVALDEYLAGKPVRVPTSQVFA